MHKEPKSLQELDLSEDFLFAKVMSDPEVCRITLEKILAIPIREISIPTTQKSINLLLESKGVRLDVYAASEKGECYACEMQNGRRRELPRRSRYYHSCLDLDLIAAGKPYESLAKTFVIFICTFDPFGKGRHIYTFEKTCREDQELTLGDETVTIFLNTKGTVADVSKEMQEFLAYVEDTTDAVADQAESNWVKQIHQKVKAVKQSKEMEVEYMVLLQRDRENLEQGRLEGRTEGRVEGARIIKQYLRGKSSEEIASYCQLDLVYVEEIIANYENS